MATTSASLAQKSREMQNDEDIESNEEKINHHGKRASDIVKSMLEHSRQGDGNKELTDINKLADEYLRLSYHGIRAKDKSFNTIIEADFDPTIKNINIISQDVGRVVLNLLTKIQTATKSIRPTTNCHGIARL